MDHECANGSASQRLKFGLIGAGGIGAVRAAAVRKTDRAILSGVYDIDPARAAKVAEGARVYDSAMALIMSDEIDAVIISTPPPSHRELAVAALEDGKHVLVEKPMAASVDECRQMIAAAAKAKRVLTVGFNHRYFNAIWGLDSAEDNALALFKSSEGVLGSLQASWGEWKGYSFHVEAYGSKGMVRAYYAPMMSTVITMDKPGGERKIQRNVYPADIVREKFQGWQSAVIGAFVEEIQDFWRFPAVSVEAGG